MNVLHFYLLIYICMDMTWGYPLDEISNTFVATNSSNDSQTTISSEINSEGGCSEKVIDSEDVIFLENGHIYIPAYNATVSPTNFMISRGTLCIFLQPTDELKKDILKRCDKFADEKEDFKMLPNGSVILFGHLLENTIFDINEDGKLLRCAPDYDEIPEYELDEAFSSKESADLSDEDKVSSIIGIVGSCISVLVLLLHIAVFFLVRTSRNLPDYYLLSLCIAFLLAYFFVLFGQIPNVIGTSCIASAILQQYFFLVAFFWTNVMAFDVWKMLKMATTQLMLSTEVSRRRQFLWYSLYAWLVPLSIIVGAVVVEHAESLSSTFKLQYGEGDICWINNDRGKIVFFLLPAITIFLMNAVFFIMSAIIIKRNPIKEPGYQSSKQRARVNLVLYIRLVIMMGITWLIGVIGIVSRNFVIMCIADVFNSLQGLFLFLLFTCSKKVVNSVRDKLCATPSKSEFDKNTTDTTKCDSK